ncbi:MAG: efflux RND transporter periplasmic adaptor subunit [Bacteroidetes bacterium]|nr:MAG: efflux RND transporter periplasmic adaptor subunit [Bacteroidota bacterium]
MKSLYLFALFALFFASCEHNHENEKLDEHEEVKIQFTAYSSEFELFAEADPFIIGEISNVLSHFSHLPSFKALEKGSMTIRLIVNGKETIQTLDNASRKGIYSFDIKPETVGEGQIIFDINSKKEVLRVVVPNITVFTTKKEAHKAAGELVISRTNTTVFTKEQSWKVDFETKYPQIEPFGQIIKTTAQLQSTQGDEILVSAKTNGIVTFSSSNVLEGKSALVGKSLFTISGSGLANNNSTVRFLEAKNNYEKTKLDYERLKELVKDKIVSEKDLLNAKNKYDNAKLIYDNLNKNFNSTGQRVVSPKNGFIKQLFVQNGQYVETGQAIVSISQNRTLLLKVDVQQKYTNILGQIHSANIRTLHDNKTYTLAQLNGKVLSYGRNVNKDNFLIPVNLQIDNKGSFISGGFVEIYLKTLTNIQALTIPNTALLEEQGVYFVFAQITPELFEKREVKIGATDGLKTEILKGISQNERIVSMGAILIKLAQATGTLDAHAGHVH